MSTQTQAAQDAVEVVDPQGRPGPHTLSRNALGAPALFFCIATAAAPLTALLFNGPLTILGAGWAGPAAFLAATVILAIFTVGYVQMAKRVTTAGGFYSFVSHGFGRTLGLGTAALITFVYAILTASIVGIFAYFANSSINDWLGVDIPVWILLFGVIGVWALFALLNIQITARVLGVFFLAEVAGALVLAFAIVFAGGDSGLTAAPLNPVKLFDNPAAVGVFGAAAPGIALFAAFWSWVGYEMAPQYSEEIREPKRILSKATFLTLLFLGVFYTFVTWAFVNGYGTDKVAQGVNAQFEGKVASAWYPLTDRYVGSALTTLFELLIITSAFACGLAFFNTASRYVFALGRERILPAALGRTHESHRTPHLASFAVAGFVALWVLAFYIDDSSTEAALLKLATWTPLVGVFGLLLVQALVSFAIIRWFRTEGADGFHWVKTFAAPLLGGALMLFSAYLLLDNRETLAGANGVPFIQYGPWIVVGVFAVGIAAGLWFRARDAARYQAVGRFVYEDA